MTKLKIYVKLEPTGMFSTGLGQKFFRAVGYFQAEIEADDSQCESSIFTIKDNPKYPINLIIGTYVIHQGTLSGNDVKLY